MTSLEGRLLRRRRAIDPPAQVRDELWVLSELARRFGHHFPRDAAEVFDELARASAGGKADYSAISHARLDEGEVLFWPCTPTAPQGTPRMFLDGFPTPDGRARLVPVSHRGPVEEVDAVHPLYLTTGRVLQHYQSGAQTRRVEELQTGSPGPVAEIHPALADLHGLHDGDLVRLVGIRGSIELRVALTTDIRRDTVFVAFHWAGDLSANLLTSDATDPISGMPEFKVCSVRLEPLTDDPAKTIRTPLPLEVPA